MRSVLGDTTGFINKMLFYDVSKTPESVLAKVRNTYLKIPDFNPESVGNKSQAAKCLCVWALSVSKF